MWHCNKRFRDEDTTMIRVLVYAEIIWAQNLLFYKWWRNTKQRQVSKKMYIAHNHNETQIEINLFCEQALWENIVKCNKINKYEIHFFLGKKRESMCETDTSWITIES
jgi:hypothetical protein